MSAISTEVIGKVLADYFAATRAMDLDAWLATKVNAAGKIQMLRTNWNPAAIMAQLQG